jgi:hypothetical protein
LSGLGFSEQALCKPGEEVIMLRKTLVTLVSVAALSLGSAAMAAGKGGGGGGGGMASGGGGMGGGGGGMGGHPGGGFGGGIGGGAGAMGVARGPVGGPGPGAMSRGFATPGTFNRAGPMATAPITGGRVQGWNGRNNFAWRNNHFHNRFRNRNFFAFGFGGGPYYDYAYNSCWAQVPTRRGWRWVYVCGDYGY